MKEQLVSMQTVFQWGNEFETSDAVTARGDGRMMSCSGRDGRRKRRPTTRVGGMHCRRNKRWTWGHGHAAGSSHLMAVARCVAFIVALASSTAMADDFTWLTIGDPGNPGNPANSGFGAVDSTFKMSAFETTNAQYTTFLNGADPTGVNPNQIFSAAMSSQSTSGITFDAGASNGAKYSVKSGFANKPVVFVSWLSAARFVNWLTTGGTSTETGSYNMSLSSPVRLTTAVYVLPSFNEYYKAAFYTGVGDTYNLYQTSFNSTPVASGAGTANANTAIYGGASAVPAATGPLDVGSFTGTTSPYGLFDALGNVTEYTDTVSPNPAQRYRVGGNWSMALADLPLIDASGAPIVGGLGQTIDNTGFRIAMVPEPGTISMAIMGGVALLGAGAMRRRRTVTGADTVESLD